MFTTQAESNWRHDQNVCKLWKELDTRRIDHLSRMPAPLHLRLSFRLRGCSLQDGSISALELVVSTRPRVTVVLTDAPGENTIVATAASVRTTNAAVRAGFVALSQLRAPEDCPPESAPFWRRLTTADGNLRTNDVPRTALPKGMADFILQANRELAEGIRRAARVLRWRLGLDGEHYPFSLVGPGAEWSLEESLWFVLPSERRTLIRQDPIVRPTVELQGELQATLGDRGDEPIAHQLFREAYGHRRDNRRSALVIGVAALEVGVKAFLGDRVPDARWLISNLVAPPIHRMLAEFLPTVPAPCMIDRQVKAPPKAVLDTIKKAVEIRNRIAHATGEDVSRDTLEECLLAIRDTLWLMDFYSGATWALANVSDTTRTALGA